jgi:hypothetical protein
LRYRGDDGADDFGAVGADVEREADERGREGIEQDADARQAVEDDEELDQQRRAADDPDIEAGDGDQRRRPNRRAMAVSSPRISPNVKDSNVSGMVKTSPAQSRGTSESPSVEASAARACSVFKLT